MSRKVSRGSLERAELVKIVGRGEKAKVAARLPLAGSVGGAFALDESGEKPVLWLAGGGELVRVEDRGDELAGGSERFLNRDPGAIAFVGYMDVDAEADLVYVTGSREKVWRFHGETGEGGLLPIKAVDLAVGPGGTVYTWGTGGYHGPIARYTRDLKPAPLASRPANIPTATSPAARDAAAAVCGMDVDAQGRVYVTDGSNICHVRVYDADGRLVAFPRRPARRATVLRSRCRRPWITSRATAAASASTWPATSTCCNTAVPKGHKPPPGYENDEAYRAAVGTVLKFGPRGGTRKTPLLEGGRGGDPLAYEGTLAMYPGCGPISSWRCDGACACTKPRFDVDGFGRLYLPNAITFSVSVRDNAGNEIVQFGRYGNFDCGGPASAEPQPDIPLGWPIAAGASDKYIYVGDCLNHRVVRLDKTFAVEAICR